jgi:peptidoglycan/LPS O-acetylase OafA/YrhL
VKYRAEIDGLRALAVLPVILFHAGFEWFSGGFVGVDVFFVISGFLITTIIISELDEKRFSIVTFYERRARRILPALFFVMAACLPFAWFWMLPWELIDFGRSLIGASTFTSNIVFWQEDGYFANATERKPLIHTWSLAVEEQFYILFPIFLMLIWRWGLRFTLLSLMVVFLISLVLAQWGSYYKPSPNFYLLPTRGWELLLGVFVSLFLFRKNHLKSHLINEVLSLLGLSMIAYSVVVFNEQTPFPSFHTLIPTIGTVLVILCSVSGTVTHRILSAKPIVLVGLISYSAYLWHQPLLAFASIRFGPHLSVLSLAGLSVTSLLLAYFSWRYVEAPFRNKKKASQKVIFSLSLIGLLSFFSIGFVLIKNSGFEYRNVPYSELKAQVMWGSEANRSSGCVDKFGGDQYCVVDELESPITTLLLGDSHANHFFRGLSEHIRSEGGNLLMLGAGGCPPILDIDMGLHYAFGVKLNCFSRMSNLWRQTVLNNPVDKVYLSFSQEILFDRKVDFIDIIGEENFAENRYVAVKHTLKRTIDFYQQHGANVILIEDLPDSNMEAYESCLWRTRLEENCLSILQLSSNNEEYDQLLDELEASGVTILRTRKSLITFPFTDSEQYFMYRDNTHLTQQGSAYVIRSSILESKRRKKSLLRDKL